MADAALGDAAEQEAAEPAVAVRADGDEVVGAALGGLGDDLRRRALDEVDVERVAVLGDELVGLGLRGGEHGVAHGRPREPRLAEQRRAPRAGGELPGMDDLNRRVGR